MSVVSRCMFCMEEKGASASCPHCGVIQPPPDPHGRSLLPGTVVGGKYLLGRVLGQGGFGITYLAWDDMLQRKLAIKEYLPRDFATRGNDGLMVVPYAGEEETHFERGRKKFLAEGQVLVKFQHHPGIVSSFDYLEANGTAYLVMEYLAGRTFETFLHDSGGILDPRMATMVMLQVMDALRALHHEGLVHRDVSPDNIYITDSNQVKLLDFGSARHALRHSLSVDVVIKRGYSPVEQYQERGKIGPWTDIYATAATLYRAMAGEAPPDSIERLTDDRLIPPSSRGIVLPPEAEQALLAALAVDPAYRLHAIEELQRPLLAFSGIEGGAYVPRSSPHPADSSSTVTPTAEGATERVVSRYVPPAQTEEVVTGRPPGASWPPTPGAKPPLPRGGGLRGGSLPKNRQMQMAAAALVVLLLLIAVYWIGKGSSGEETPTTGVLVVRIDRAAYATLDGFKTSDDGQSRSQRHVFSGLTPGRHRLKVWLEGYEEIRRQISVEAGESKEIILELDR